MISKVLKNNDFYDFSRKPLTIPSDYDRIATYLRKVTL
tara:strand:- start:2849 stop:2962 length:114 start_codon:yes stop_codon:yes gene_type:complete